MEQGYGHARMVDSRKVEYWVRYLANIICRTNQLFAANDQRTQSELSCCHPRHKAYIFSLLFAQFKIFSGSFLYLVPSSPEPNWFTIAQCFYFLGKACCRSSTQVIQFQNKKAVKFRLTNTINISDIQILTKTCLGGVITTRTFGSSLPLTILPGVPLLLGFR